MSFRNRVLTLYLFFEFIWSDCIGLRWFQNTEDYAVFCNWRKHHYRFYLGFPEFLLISRLHSPAISLYIFSLFSALVEMRRVYTKPVYGTRVFLWTWKVLSTSNIWDWLLFYGDCSMHNHRPSRGAWSCEQNVIFPFIRCSLYKKTVITPRK